MHALLANHIVHALLARVYHLMLYAIHIATRPIWRPLGACLAIALGGRLAGFARRSGGAVLLAGAAVLAGWLFETAQPSWPLPPVSRLSGLAVILTLGRLLCGRGGRAWCVPATAVLAAWWLRGAPTDGPGVLGCVPVALGVWLALVAGARLARSDRGWASLAASGGLACGLLAAGASPHWARAAGVPALAAVGLLGTAEAMPALAWLILAVSLSALVASDRGRYLPVDVACAAPLLVWVLVPWLARRWGLPAASALAACVCVALAWAAKRAIAAM